MLSKDPKTLAMHAHYNRTEAPAPAAPVLRACQFCGFKFQATRSWQRFCSDKCRTEFNAAEKEAARVRREDLIDQLTAEIEKLQAENAALRKQLDQL
jgi:hypothetical protein